MLKLSLFDPLSSTRDSHTAERSLTKEIHTLSTEVNLMHGVLPSPTAALAPFHFAGGGGGEATAGGVYAASH